jgi:glyoxalase family protein
MLPPAAAVSAWRRPRPSCVPAASIGYWTHRLIEKGVKHEALTKRFGEPVLSFFDPDGMSLALVGIFRYGGRGSVEHQREISAQHAIRWLSTA